MCGSRGPAQKSDYLGSRRGSSRGPGGPRARGEIFNLYSIIGRELVEICLRCVFSHKIWEFRCFHYGRYGDKNGKNTKNTVLEVFTQFEAHRQSSSEIGFGIRVPKRAEKVCFWVFFVCTTIIT